MDVFTFGKYKGVAVIAVCVTHPHYALWAHSTVSWFGLTPEQLSTARSNCAPRRLYVCAPGGYRAWTP